MDDEAVRTAARWWVDGDPDPTTRAALAAALTRDDLAALRAAVAHPLAFGTAGLRGPVGPGPARMNRATVRRTTWALAAHLDATGHAGRVVCVGYDARPDSERFALDVAGVLVAAGHPVIGWTEPTPTPLVAWAARESQSAAAVVITASHNPPADNGYKLYGADAIQIVPPTDADIAARIAAAPPADQVPCHPDPWESGHAEELGPFARRRYLEQVAELVAHDGDRGEVRVVHTALHGVGGRMVGEALASTGVTDVHVVAAQHEPDGTFPTVSFPNPEEPGAMDEAFALATEVDADLVLANDPDADRLAVGVRDGDVGGWRRLTGNEVAALLADDLLGRAGERALVATSCVTSPWIADVAAHHGARHEATLTGFKWLWHCALALAEEGWEPVLGAEEALGYSVGSMVRDKDGIAAAVCVVDLARRLAATDRTLSDRLHELRARDGHWVTAQVSEVRSGPDGPAAIRAMMAKVRSEPPTELAGVTVERVEDLAVGAEHRAPWFPDSDLVLLHLDGGRALLRPSGTEPKIKAYVDLRTPTADPRTSGRAESVARALLRACSDGE